MSTPCGVKFESLISPPWPLTEEPDAEHNSIHLQRKQENLSNFERNERSEENARNSCLRISEGFRGRESPQKTSIWY